MRSRQSGWSRGISSGGTATRDEVAAKQPGLRPSSSRRRDPHWSRGQAARVAAKRLRTPRPEPEPRQSISDCGVPVRGAATRDEVAVKHLGLRQRIPRPGVLGPHAPSQGSRIISQQNPQQGGVRVEGERIGPYRLAARLGAGGMGEVYKAYDERLDRWVAVKRISPQRSGDAAQRERLLREARASARLSHPAIVQVFDLVQADGADCIVMEL